MWKREEASKPLVPPAQAAAPSGRPGGLAAGRDIVNIGKSVVIKGDLSGSEDLTIEGHVEGKIELKQHVLTIGPHGRIRAEVFAKSVVILGQVIGNIAATDKVAIRDNGSVEGDIAAPKVAIAEGAKFRGGIDMNQQGAGAGAEKGQAQPRAGQDAASGKGGKAAEQKAASADDGAKKADSEAAAAAQ